MRRSVKRYLRKVLGKSLLSFDELSTFMTEVESILNSLPSLHPYDELAERL